MANARAGSSYSHILMSWGSLEQKPRFVEKKKKESNATGQRAQLTLNPVASLAVLDVPGHGSRFLPTEVLDLVMQRQMLLKIPKLVFPLPKGQLRGRIFACAPSCSAEVYKSFQLIQKLYFHKRSSIFLGISSDLLGLSSTATSASYFSACSKRLSNGPG